MESITFFDAPDGYHVGKDRVIIFEHFEFDSTRNNRKGSEQRQEQKRMDYKFNQWAKGHEGIFTQKTKAISSTAYLANNFNKVLTSHCNKFNNYKNNLIKSGIVDGNIKFELCLIAENVDWFGMSCIDKGKWLELVL